MIRAIISALTSARALLWRFISYGYLRFKGVEVFWPGPEVDILPYIYKHPGSRIIIGHDCAIISGNRRNPAGILRRSSIATLSSGALVELKENVHASGLCICCVSTVVVDENSRLGVNCAIYDTDFHPVDALKRRGQSSINDADSKPIAIGSDVWIGANVIILKGVIIGARAVVGAGSVVTRDVNSDCLAAGIPCRMVRPI